MSDGGPVSARVKVFVDCETTGLDRDRHQAFEIALWEEFAEGPKRFFVPHTLDHAAPDALRINRYHERGMRPRPVTPQSEASRTYLASLLADVTLVAANARFDADMIGKVLGFEPWHYRVLDVEAYAYGILGGEADWDDVPGLVTIRETLVGFGHPIPVPDHTALADVATLRAVYLTLTLIRDGRVPVRIEER